ncbi:MAG TPA: 4Fe-4S binding protein, partial [Spirochaetia bacterium]|nr:4Fe-4S binding protein [Spirochaetia bacterium]
YINNLCSCKSPECAGIRPRLDFGIMSIHKAEYVADLHPGLCRGCLQCVARCPFGAITADRKTGVPRVSQEACYGCGVCRHACDTGALFLVPRADRPAVSGRY